MSETNLSEPIGSDDNFKEFARRVVRAYCWGVGIDGGDVQEWADELGIIKAVEAKEPCGDNCNCAEFATWPCICYRFTEMMENAQELLPR